MREPLTAPARVQRRITDRAAAGARRVRLSAWSVGQSALGAATAWEAATRLLGHPAPFFAAVAAVVCLSVSVLGRLRRVGELALGVTIGVGLGDLLVGQIGRGAWQLGAVVLFAMACALLLDGGSLIVTQAALQAVFVVALPPPTGGYVGRWLDALTGGVTALVIAFLLPADPRTGLRRSSADVAAHLAQALRGAAAAARRGDPDAAFAALEQARATEPVLAAWNDAIRAAEEISRLSPLRRHADPEISAHRHGAVHVDRAVRNLRVALRRIVAAVDDAQVHPPAGHPASAGSEIPPAVLDRLDDLAGALFTLPGLLRDPDGEGRRRAEAALRALAGRLGPEHLGARTMSATVVVAQVRSAVVDLLQVAGLSLDDARAALGT